MNNSYQEAIEYIKGQYKGNPLAGIVLGTGLGGLVNEITISKELSYNFIPNFPISTVESHFGKLIFGKIGNTEVVAMQGRFHLYEGYGMDQITFPIRVMKLLGVRDVYISNACGGMNLKFKKGSLMIIEDHINFQGSSPLIGPNLSEFGPRFPDMSSPYDRELIAKAEKIAAEENININKGTYVAVTGPQLETRAEYRFLRSMGADVVGMSTVPEVIVAAHMGMRTFAISVITDECDPDNLKPINVPDIIATAEKAEPLLTKILSRMIKDA